MKKLSLEEIAVRLDRLEKAVFGRDPASPTKKPREPSGSGLPSRIIDLRNKGFFKQPRTASEVHRKLSSSYHCELNRVVMALLRLQKRKQFRKSSKQVGKKKQVAYVW